MQECEVLFSNSINTTPAQTLASITIRLPLRVRKQQYHTVAASEMCGKRAGIDQWYWRSSA